MASTYSSPPTVPIVGQVTEKLIVRLFRESWFSILVGIITFTFTLGMTYAAFNAKLDAAAQQIEEVKTQRIVDKNELNYRLDMLDKKLDEINRYLRDHK